VPQPDELTVDEAVAAEYNRLRGRLCGLVESWDLGTKMISTLKSLTYDSEATVKELVS
jgi:hypothetical protein